MVTPGKNNYANTTTKTTMRNSFSLYRRLVGIQIRSQMMYRVSFFTEAFGVALITLLEYASLALVFAKFENLGGWNLGQVAFLYGLAELSFGIMDLFFSGFDPDNFGLQIRRGFFDQLLLRPVNITLQVIGSEFVLRRFGKIIIGLLIFLSALNLNPVSWTFPKMSLTLLAIFSQVCFFGGLFITGSTITFWTVESVEVINIFTYGGSYMISHPMHIFPTSLRRFFTFIIPAAFLNYYPALYILGIPDPNGLPKWVGFLAPFAGVTMLVFSLAFWRYGIRHYKSTGS
jgi:ABC-2 type transport system permease protein